MTNFAKFLSHNGLKRKDIASFLGVSGAFISQISAGTRSLPIEKLAQIKANPFGWDTSMLTPSQSAPVGGTPAPEKDALVDYLQRKVDEQEKLIHELYQQIGMLKANLKLP